MLTLDQLRAISPNAPESEVASLDASMEGMDPRERAMYIAQLSVECDGFTAFVERWGPTPDQIHYERPPGAQLSTDPDRRRWPLWQRLGNLEAGDGRKFRGHGGIQITGGDNHRECGTALGVDADNHPELLALPENRYRASRWFWDKHNLRAPAMDGDVTACTRIINGLGMNGLEDRRSAFYRACPALGVDGVCG